MRKLLCLLLLTALLAGAKPRTHRVTPPPGVETLEAQSARCNAELWRIQKHYGQDGIYITLNVLAAVDMREKGVWGDAWGDDNGWHIEILDLQEYPKDMPAADAIAQQGKVVMHEFLHLVLTELGVPGEAQDGLIRSLQPYLWQ